jgi:hypothetical protein
MIRWTPDVETSLLRADHFYRSVIVAMVAVHVVHPAAHEIVLVIAVRDRLVSTLGSVLMIRALYRRALCGVGLVDVHHMLIDMVLVRMMQVAVMQVVHVIVVAYGYVATVLGMFVIMLGMALFFAGRHWLRSFQAQGRHQCRNQKVNKLIQIKL